MWNPENGILSHQANTEAKSKWLNAHIKAAQKMPGLNVQRASASIIPPTTAKIGEKVHRPLIAGLFVIVLCAVLYFSLAAIGQSDLYQEQLADYQPTIADSFCFSVVSFTTLGYGDLVPKLGFRWLASTEAALGAASSPPLVVLYLH